MCIRKGMKRRITTFRFNSIYLKGASFKNILTSQFLFFGLKKLQEIHVFTSKLHEIKAVSLILAQM